MMEDKFVENALRTKSIIYKDELKGYDIKRLVIPRNIEGIENYAFSHQNGIEEIYFEPNKLIDGLMMTCNDMRDLRRIDVGEGYRVLTMTFCDCVRLKDVSLPHSLEVMYMTFEGCKTLEKIYIPEKVNFIQSAFSGCKKLSHVEIDRKNPNFTYYGGMIYSKDYRKVYAYIEGAKELRFHPNTESIESYSFRGCEKLRNIELPPRLKEIKKYAFDAGIEIISKHTLHSGIKIDSNAFMECEDSLDDYDDDDL